LALPLFAITLFVSAFLLFLVQPMIGKMILPKLGGTPQVWNTCCVFFQTVLLLGYFYTHATTHYLKPRKQMILHGALLFIPLILLFARGISVEGWEPPEGVNPIWSTLKVLAIVIGVPFFVVSTSAPLLQKWFSFSGDPTANDPYFLYGASNLGSLLSLLLYPFIFEPAFYLTTQAVIWTISYAVLVILILASASFVWKSATSMEVEAAAPAAPVPDPLPAIAPTPEPKTAIQPSRLAGKKKGLKGPASTTTMKAPSAPSIAKHSGYNPQEAPVDWLRVLRWILLPAIPSSLMLGVTTYVSTDLSPFPFLWVIPLSLYLLSFILVFAKWPIPWTEGPHQIFLYGLPIAILVMSVVIFTHDYSPGLAMWAQFLMFFWVTMALHGELAKDRPAPRHLTLFFLCMSIGGMLGGVFNAIFAPIVFKGVYEYPLAIIAACLVRPNFSSSGWLDGLFLRNNANLRESAMQSSDNFLRSIGRKPTGEPFLFSYALDVAIGLGIAIITYLFVTYRWSVSPFLQTLEFLGFNIADPETRRPYSQLVLFGVYIVPIIACVIVMPRSLRYAFGVGMMLYLGAIHEEREGVLKADRSYFGVLRVSQDKVDLVYSEAARGGSYIEGELLKKDPNINLRDLSYNYLMHGSTYHGRNYQQPELSRLATTYYHRYGPVGAITEKYNWFPGPQNTYWADLRGPSTMIGLGAVPMGGLPLTQIVNCWSEPPTATVGLGTGTMASYTRWLSHMAYYEIDEKIRDMNRPPLGPEGQPVREPYFLYVKDAGDRGANIEIIMGDARQSLQNENKRLETWSADPKRSTPYPKRENYYKYLNLDAFSSDAIPVHLITKEAIALYMSKLADDGVLMVHTSNRHMRLPLPVADICNALKLDAYLAHDNGGIDEAERGRGGKMDPRRAYSMGHFSSEYVMVARKGVLDKAKLDSAVKRLDGKITTIVEWKKLPAPGNEVWTDHYQNIRSILR
jgi:hypothetical protein